MPRLAPHIGTISIIKVSNHCTSRSSASQWNKDDIAYPEQADDARRMKPIRTAHAAAVKHKRAGISRVFLRAAAGLNPVGF